MTRAKPRSVTTTGAAKQQKKGRWLITDPGTGRPRGVWDADRKEMVKVTGNNRGKKK